MSLYNKSKIMRVFDLFGWIIIECQRQAETFLTTMHRGRRLEEEIGFNFLQMPFFAIEMNCRDIKHLWQRSFQKRRQTKLFDAVWGLPVLRITIQLVDTLVIIHCTHAYYPRETEQWFFCCGKWTVRSSNPCQNNRPMHSSQQWNNGWLEGSRHLSLPWV